MVFSQLFLLALVIPCVLAGRSSHLHCCRDKSTCESPILFCDGPENVPNRYIIKFKDTATEDEILSHLKIINGSFVGTDCSLGEWIPPCVDPTCGTNCIRVDVKGQAQGSEASAEQVVVCSNCSFTEFTWHRNIPHQPATCGFTYTASGHD